MTSSNKIVTAIYCDDIRNELGAKLSFIGVYSADMLLPSFPITLPKFCVFVSVRLPVSEYPKEHIAISLFQGNNEISTMEMDKEGLAQSKPLPHDSEPALEGESSPEERSIVLSIGITISPISFEAPTLLKVRAKIDGEEIKGNSLKIKLQSET